jgi:hypothetical protein
VEGSRRNIGITQSLRQVFRDLFQKENKLQSTIARSNGLSTLLEEAARHAVARK